MPKYKKYVLFFMLLFFIIQLHMPNILKLIMRYKLLQKFGIKQAMVSAGNVLAL